MFTGKGPHGFQRFRSNAVFRQSRGKTGRTEHTQRVAFQRVAGGRAQYPVVHVLQKQRMTEKTPLSVNGRGIDRQIAREHITLYIAFDFRKLGRAVQPDIQPLPRLARMGEAL